MVVQNVIDNWAVQFRALMAGDRWCVACGRVCIPKDRPSYIIRCENCFRDFMETAGKGPTMVVRSAAGKIVPQTKVIQLPSRGRAKHCSKCGTDLERDRVEHALRMSGGARECTNCLSCSRGWTTPIRNVFVPSHWKAHVDEILKALHILPHPSHGPSAS